MDFSSSNPAGLSLFRNQRMGWDEGITRVRKTVFRYLITNIPSVTQDGGVM